MTFKPAIWFPIAVVLSIANLVAVGFAAGDAEPLHAATHAALALAFGLWAQRLRRGPIQSGASDRLTVLEAEVRGELEESRAEVLGELQRLRTEMSELNERMDFAERLLAKGQEPRRVGPQP